MIHKFTSSIKGFINLIWIRSKPIHFQACCIKTDFPEIHVLGGVDHSLRNISLD